jgi:pimeloyl-ACP methyl ester carboxylesterase
MKSWPFIVAMVSLIMTSASAFAQSDRHRELVRSGDVQIDVIVEGRGPLVVMLPSRGRDSEDYDEVAAMIAASGFQVLRPQPRGIGRSAGPMDGLTLHDFARDVAAVIEERHNGRAVIVGHAYGNWVARMTAVDFPHLVRGVVLAAAAAKAYPPELSRDVTKSADPSLPPEERRKYLERVFFAPGNDPSVWLHGWYPEVSKSQRLAAEKTRQAEWWAGGTAPLLDLQAEQDPFKTPAQRNELKDELGERVTIAVIANASHALLPEQPKATADAIVGWIRKLPP